jgi:cobalt-zinc-cadmium efflux system protein
VPESEPGADAANGARLELPLPPGLDCTACLDALHVRLHAIPSVRVVSVLSDRHAIAVEVVPEAEADESLRRRAQQILDEVAGTEHATHAKPAAVLPVLQVSNPPTPGSATPDGPHHAHDGHPHDDHDHAGHSHHGDHGHDHDHGAELHEMARSNRRKLLLALVIGTSVLVAEILVGLLANSLALLADAAHAITDQASVALALIAVSWGMRAATRSKTFGFRRGEVVAAFVNALALWAVSAYFIFESLQRLSDPPEVQGRLVVLMGAITLVANLAAAKVLHGGSSHNLNMRAAFLHVLSDALGSAAALVAGLLVTYKGWHAADPALTLFIAALIVVFTWKLTRQSLHILMEGTPGHADGAKVAQALRSIPGVRDVHDLHVWTHTPGMDSLTAHIVADLADYDGLTRSIQAKIRREFRIDHITVQVERPGFPCETLHHKWEAPA